jgi:diguanylate cyclase (GGDEF)-like protein
MAAPYDPCAFSERAHVPTSAGAAESLRTDPRQLILGHTLLIITAATEDRLITRTLAAACDVTGAAMSAAIGPDGTSQTYGSRDLAARVEGADAAALRALGPARTGLELPSAITARLGEMLIIVAAGEGRPLVPDAGTLLALLVAHAKAARDRLREVASLSLRADLDPLTGLGHLGPFAQRLDDVAPARTAVLVLDLDDFKKINDLYGHQAGDQALVSLVNALRAGLRGDDRLYRIGGDEFAVVVEVNGPAEVVAIARRLLDAARQVGRPISVGAAIHAPGETGRDTLERADRALYEAKRSGRNTARLAA